MDKTDGRMNETLIISGNSVVYIMALPTLSLKLEK